MSIHFSFLVGLLVIRRSIFTLILEIKYWYRRSILRRKFQEKLNIKNRHVCISIKGWKLFYHAQVTDVSNHISEMTKEYVYMLFLFFYPQNFWSSVEWIGNANNTQKKRVQPKVLWTYLEIRSCWKSKCEAKYVTAWPE